MRYISPVKYPVLVVFTISVSLPLMVSGCAGTSAECPSGEHADLSKADTFSGDPELPFRFPLDNLSADQPGTGFAVFGYSGYSPDAMEYHAAEDYYQPAGSPVYAMADGTVSFSGSMGGYGWLITIDHPDIDAYSLYGHLSHGRWHINSGRVEKGQLIAYLGDSDENGGSIKDPVTPHLHFAVRAGLREDYPSIGEWRWQAGWVKYCPQDLGWLQPSLFICNQYIPDGGFSRPEATFLEIWWVELLWSAIVLVGVISALVMTTLKGKNFLSLMLGICLAAATWFAFIKEFKIGYILLALFIILVSLKVYNLIRVKRERC